ncbi:MAG: ABC transporter substrate-binding protein [Ideonella sp.]|nr:ABC transporter substrate-binding protein [Ideonella sp.]MCC7459529.1 ABC transporter substrate-binding protein [Nitrospira sp.]
MKRMVRAWMAALASAALLWAMPATAQMQGVSDNEIVLGTLLDLSGPINFWGLPIKNGMEMAVDDLNAGGGINGRRVRLVIEDMAYDPKKAVLAAQKLLNQDRIFAMVGQMGTVTAAATMPLVLKAGLPHVFPVTPAELFFEPHHKLKFAFFTPYYDDIRTGVKYMVQTHGKQRVGVMYQDDEFGANIVKGVRDQLDAMKLPLVSQTSYKRGATDFSSQIAKLKSDGVDLVVLGTVVRETIGAMAAARQLGWNVDFLTSQAAYAPEVPALGKAAVEGLFGAGMTPIPDAATSGAEVAAWMKRYQQRFDKPANVQAVIGYIVIQTAAIGLKNAGRNLTPETFAAGIEQIRDHRNIFGTAPMSFSAESHLGSRQVFMARVQNGKWVRSTDFMHY